MKTLVKLVVNTQNKLGTRYAYTSECGIQEARRLAKSHTKQATGWCEVIFGDLEWYEHYENGQLVPENSKLKQEQDAVNDQRIIVAKMSRESCVELFKIKHTYQSKPELARVLECSEQDAEETLYARIESLLSQIVETTGENMDSLYWELDAEAYNA
jgi:hypothetical protein